MLIDEKRSFRYICIFWYVNSKIFISLLYMYVCVNNNLKIISY